LTVTTIKPAPITVEVNRRKELLLDAFVGRRIKSLNVAQTPFTTLVKKLHESLTRMESFDVVTVAQSSDGATQFQSPVPNIPHPLYLDSKRSSPSLLARQLRLRLVAVDDSDIPRNLHNIVVSIHAIATFQALHDYLRPRVAGLLNSGSRLHGMLAALAASGFNSSTQRSNNLDSAPQPPQPPISLAESSSPVASSSSASTLGRRRSQRLSAKNPAAGGTDTEPSPSAPDTVEAEAPAIPEAEPLVADAPPNETLLDPELAADFSDDEEIDADMFDEVDADRSVSEKTVMLSVAEGEYRLHLKLAFKT